MKNYRQHGDTLDFVAPSGGVVSGSPVRIGNLLVVPVVTAAVGVTFAGRIEGVFDVVKHGAGSGQAWAAGDPVYWDAGNSRFTRTASGNLLAGVAVAAALTGDTAGAVKLIQTLTNGA